MSDRQLDILDFYVEFMVRYGVPPSFTVVAQAFGLKSRSAIEQHVKRLVKNRHLRRVKVPGQNPVYLPAHPRIVVQLTDDNLVRVVTPGPVLLVPEEYRDWLTFQLRPFAE